MAKKKSWSEKLNDAEGLPKVVLITEKMSQRWGGGTLAIPAPIEVDEIMKKVPKGKLITINEIRETIAKKHNATIGCPLTCGIFAWVAANAAEEERLLGAKRITPWWRTLKSGGYLNEKYPAGPDYQKSLLESEGHTVIQKGKKFQVADFEKRLASLAIKQSRSRCKSKI